MKKKICSKIDRKKMTPMFTISTLIPENYMIPGPWNDFMKHRRSIFARILDAIGKNVDADHADYAKPMIDSAAGLADSITKLNQLERMSTNQRIADNLDVCNGAISEWIDFYQKIDDMIERKDDAS